MGSGAYVGRVGGLAVALGIGAAMTTGQGVAWATPTSGGDKDSSAQEGSAKPGDDSGHADGPGPSTRAKGPLAKLAERLRTSTTAPRTDRTHPALNLPKLSATRIRPGAATEATAGDGGGRPAAAPRTKPRGLDSLRARLDDAVAEPPMRTTRKPEALEVEPDPVSALPKLSPRDRLNTVVVKVEQAVEQVTRRVEPVSISALPTALPTAKALQVPPAAAAVTAPVTPTVPTLVSGFLAATGLAPLAPLAGSSPVAPPQSPALWTLLAWARREYERSINPTGRTVTVAPTAMMAAAAVVDPNQQTPKPAAPVVGETDKLGWVTGPGITDAPSGTPGGYGISGTDLGIMWDDGAGHVLMLFGDTFDQPNQQGVWRSNVLLRSVDHYLNDGLQIQDAVISPGGNYNLNRWDNSFGATQVIRDPGFLGLFGSTTTIIPTAAISVTDSNGNTTQYANVMSVRTWDTPGRWTTNWSAIAYSTDGGLSWTVDPNTVRSSGWLRSSTPYVPGNQNFQQGAFVKGPDGDPYVYSFGTPSGRGGSAYVARVPQDQIRDLDAYQYWAGDDKGWVTGDPSAAVPVIGATNQAPPPTGFLGWITKAINDFLGGIVVGGLTGGNVSELSVQYNPYLDKYVALYTDANNNVVMRVSDSPQGVWSDPTTLVANDLSTNTGMYAPMIHPWSGTDQLGADNEQYLYWNLSYWDAYDVQLMRTDLSDMGSSGTVAV